MGNNLLVYRRNENSLDEFAGKIFALLNVRDYTIRDSSNFVDERYFTAQALGVTVFIAHADEQDFPSDGFWIGLNTREMWIENIEFLNGLGDIVARKLAIHSYIVEVPADLGEIGSEVTVYKANPATDADYTEQVLTESIVK
jgi:hypothetical protein